MRLLDAGEFGVVATVDAGHDVEDEVRLCGEHSDGLRRPLEAVFAPAHPVMVLLQAVQADGGAAHAGGQQAPEALLREREAVGDHAPGEALLVDAPSARLQVGTHQRLPARDDHEDGVGLAPGVDAVQHAQEILAGHVGRRRHGLAVAAAVAAREVAAQRALPEELLQRMVPQDVAPEGPVDVQGQAVPQVKLCGRRHVSPRSGVCGPAGTPRA